MALESASYITQLVDTNPASTDLVGQGDDHIRMVKTVLKNSFPGNSTQAVIPDPSGNAGKFLTTDGTNNAWSDSISADINGSSLQNYAETINALGTRSGAVTIDLALGNVITLTTGGATQLSVTNLIPGKANSFTLILSGTEEITWPAGTKWSNGVSPTLGAENVIGFISVDGGGNWYGLPNTSMS